MTIRLMTGADIPAAIALWRRTPGVGLNERDDSPGGLAHLLACNPATCFVAVENGTLAGTILCGYDGSRAIVYHACVAEPCRRKGTGRALVSAVTEALKAEGITNALLVCFGTNTGALAFWRNLGWQERPDLVYFNTTILDTAAPWWIMPFSITRLSFAGRPAPLFRSGGSKPLTRSHCSSLSSCRFIVPL
jgi:ribosomal protein S18 acetylase RimI-like enzyme